MDLDVTKLYSSIEIFKKASDISAFKEWLKKAHNLELDSRIFPGYRYFLESSYHLIFNAFEHDYVFGLSESELFHRASSEGIHIGNFYPNCEKTIFLTNLKNNASIFLHANKINDLEKEIMKFNENTINVIQNILSKAFFKNNSISHKKLLNQLLIGNTYIYFHQFGNTKAPYAYITNLLRIRTPEKKLKHSLEGYKYTLQFLWYQLFENKNVPISVQQLHRAKGWTEHDNFDNNETKTKIEFVSEKNLFKSMFEDKRLDLRKRKDLDSYFWRIQRDIIRPMSNEIGRDIVEIYDSVFLKKSPNRKLFKDFLQTKEYNKKRNLSEIMFWYPAEYINNRKSSMHLGIPTFNTLLTGAVELKNYHRAEGKIRVLRFIHIHKTDNEKDENDYTYGVLINSYHGDNIYDKGWLLFFNSCADYSGFSGSEHHKAEDLIGYYLKKGEIEIETVKIELQKLEEFLEGNTTLYHEEKKLSSKVQTLEGRDKELKGSLFELFSCHYSSKMFQDSEIIWSGGNGQEDEIDIIIKNEKEIIVVECKINPNTVNLKLEIEKLREKIKLVFGESPTVKELFLFWKEPNSTQRKILEEKMMCYEHLSLIARNKVKVNNQRVFNIFDEEQKSLLDFLNLEIVE